MGQLELIKTTEHYSRMRRKKIIPVTFLLSIFIHAIALLIFQFLNTEVGIRKNPRTYRVNLIRPPMEEIKKNTRQKPLNGNHLNIAPLAGTKETTISLDTGSTVYSPYTTVIKHKIFKNWVYPLSAQKNNIQGNLLIAFRLDSDGNLLHCKTLQSSGHKILDLKALEAIKLANPFPPFPENIEFDFLTINASFSYQLTFE